MLSSIEEDKYYIKRLVGEPGDILQMSTRKYFTNGTDCKGAGCSQNGVPLNGNA